MTHSPAALAGLLERHGLSPSRALGQNFVVDANTVRRIARLAEVGPGDQVVEIGAGLGSLTIALRETGAAVTAVEIDRYIAPVLREIVEPMGVRVVEGDALHLDWGDVLSRGERWVLVANLPYNVATPLVADLLDGVPTIERMLVMVQREVGERLAAKAGDEAYGAVSVKVASWADAKVVGLVSPAVFIPRPKVDSALVRIDRLATPIVPEELRTLMFELVRAAFGQRRKMLRRTLVNAVEPEVFESAGIDSARRPEELDVHEWIRLAAAVARAATAAAS